MVKKLLVTCALVVCVSGCSKKNEYPPEVVTNFMNSCSAQPGANAELCGCILKKIQKDYSAKDFAAYEATLAMNAPDPVMTKKMAAYAVACAQSAQKIKSPTAPAQPPAPPKVKLECATGGKEVSDRCWSVKPNNTPSHPIVVSVAKNNHLMVGLVLELSRGVRKAYGLSSLVEDDLLGDDFRAFVASHLAQVPNVNEALQPAALTVLGKSQCNPGSQICDGCGPDESACIFGGARDKLEGATNPASFRNSAEGKRKLEMNAELRSMPGFLYVEDQWNSESDRINYTWATKGKRQDVAQGLLRAINAKFGNSLAKCKGAPCQKEPFIGAYIVSVAYLGIDSTSGCKFVYTSGDYDWSQCFGEQESLSPEECENYNRKGWEAESLRNTSGPQVFCAPGFTCPDDGLNFCRKLP